MLNILIVVEDKKEEREAALEAIRNAIGAVDEIARTEITPDCPIVALKSLDGNGTQILFAATLESAKDKIRFAQRLMDTVRVGVITDLMFPMKRGGKEEPNGLGVIAECIDAKLPVVVCSDTDHHEIGWLRPILPILGKAHPMGSIPVILDKKDWMRAVTLLAGISATT